MPKSYWTKIQTPNGLKYFRADDVTDGLLQKIKDEADDVFYVEYGTTTFADAEAAYLDGKTLVCREIGQTVQETRIDGLYFLIDYLATAGTYTGHFVFSNISGYAQENVVLTPSAHYEKISTTLTTREQVIATASAEIAQEYVELCHEYAADNKFPIPIGTVVTYIDNTSSDELQYMYRSKVEIAGNEWASSSPLQAPAKWDKVRVSDISGKTFFATMFTTPYSEIKAAYDSGRSIIAVDSGLNAFYHMFDCNESVGHERFRFSSVQGYTFLLYTCNKTGYDGTHGWNPQPDVVGCVDQGDIAPKYSSESTYDVGDLAYVGSGILYRCTTAISTPETWNSNHWTRTDMATELGLIDSPTNVSQGFGVAEATLGTSPAFTAALAGYALTSGNGGIVCVKFVNDVPASATLDINSTGAKAIYYNGSAIAAGTIQNGDRAFLAYDGTNYVLMGVDRSVIEMTDTEITDLIDSLS